MAMRDLEDGVPFWEGQSIKQELREFSECEYTYKK